MIPAGTACSTCWRAFGCCAHLAGSALCLQKAESLCPHALWLLGGLLATRPWVWGSELVFWGQHFAPTALERQPFIRQTTWPPWKQPPPWLPPPCTQGKLRHREVSAAPVAAHGRAAHCAPWAPTTHRDTVLQGERERTPILPTTELMAGRGPELGRAAHCLQPHSSVLSFLLQSRCRWR